MTFWARNIATVPEIIWEAFLGLWLTFKGFQSSSAILLAPERRESGIAAVYAAA